MLVLSVIAGPDTGRKFELPRDEPQLIGRSSEALPLTDNTVSRRHAELTPDDGLWWVRDLQSQNGTYINGVRIAERTRLHAGDQIRVGATVFVFGEVNSQDASIVRVMDPRDLSTEVDYRIQSNEDSVILAEPEPRAAAVDHLRVIYRLTTLTTQVANQAELLRQVMELVFTEFKPERGVIMVAPSGAEGELEPAVVKYRSRPKDDEDREIRVSRTILTAAVRQGEGVLSSNAMNDPRFESGDSVQRYNIRSAICSPIRFRDTTFGAIYIDSSMANYTFTREQLALMNAIGQHTGLALANAEHTRRQLHAERLAAMGETVAGLSHSIKNILQGLRGGADVVEMGLKKDDLKIARGGWDILKRNLDRIVSLTLNMLAFSRQRQVELELTRVGPLVEDCVQLLEARCEDKRIAMIVDADPEMPPIPLDSNLIHQALMNLLGNAIEAVEPVRGVVTVRVLFHEAGPTRPTPYAEITIIDNGIGIPSNKLAWIFEPFNTTKGLRGTGLGLAVTKRIIHEHRGRIIVESAEGRGATFRVLLPADLDTAFDPSATAENKVTAADLMRGL
ncbi:MAG: FHA domain-containing protein [Phycisphaeraceae bacterium]|nr:FHA domain-containing protein [Phycisphaeraceae bacterium]MCW5761835.1 FHA domain-containing protein [Phycisphaeraceae bacterium]